MLTHDSQERLDKFWEGSCTGALSSGWPSAAAVHAQDMLFDVGLLR